MALVLPLPLVVPHGPPCCCCIHQIPNAFVIAIDVTTLHLPLQLPHCHCFIRFHCLHKIPAAVAIITLPFPLPLLLPLQLLQMPTPSMPITRLILLLPLQLPHCLYHCHSHCNIAMASFIFVAFTQHCRYHCNYHVAFAFALPWLHFYRHYHFSPVPLSYPLLSPNFHYHSPRQTGMCKWQWRWQCDNCYLNAIMAMAMAPWMAM